MSKSAKKSKHFSAASEPWHKFLRQETKHSLWALFSFVSGIILTLSYFEKAGLVGNTIASWLFLLFGRAFFIVPIMCVLLSIAFLRAMQHKVVASTLIGGFLFLISGSGRTVPGMLAVFLRILRFSFLICGPALLL